MLFRDSIFRSIFNEDSDSSVVIRTVMSPRPCGNPLPPSVSDLTLFTVFMSLVTNVVITDDIIAVIFPRWRAKT